jgi:hypothetical protein
MNADSRMTTRVDTDYLVEDLLNCVEPFIDANLKEEKGSDWRLAVSSAFSQVLFEAPPEGAASAGSYFRVIFSMFRSHRKQLNAMQRLIKTGQRDEPAGAPAKVNESEMF